MMTARLLPLALVIGAFAIIFGYVQPTNTGSVATIKTEIASLDTALAAARDFKDKEIELTRQRAALPQEDLARLAAFLPDNVDNVQLIVDLNALAARSGVILSGFNISGAAQGAAADTPAVTDANASLILKETEPIESLELSVSATGSYNAFRTFLDGLELSLRQLDITELSVQSSETGVYTYSMTIRLYWLR